LDLLSNKLSLANANNKSNQITAAAFSITEVVQQEVKRIHAKLDKILECMNTMTIPKENAPAATVGDTTPTMTVKG